MAIGELEKKNGGYIKVGWKLEVKGGNIQG